jgi:alpha/beta superfamily hydrolase
MGPATESEAPIVEEIYFSSNAFRLHGELAYPECDRVIGAAVIAGPHPLLGGNMQNNVVRGIGDELARRQIATLRFNYRGVGRSEGPRMDMFGNLAEFWKTSHVPDEIDLWQDVQGAINCIRQAAGPQLPLALIGYSFGCALLPRLKPDLNLPPLILLAPTIAKHDYDSYLAVKNPKLVIASEDDFASDADRLLTWFDALTPPKRLIQKRFDNHFFRGHEAWLAATVFDFLRDQWRAMA